MRLGRGNCPLPLCLIPPLLERVSLEQLSVILIVFNHCLELWHTKITQMLADQPWTIPQICEALSQEVGGDGHIAHPGLVAAGLAPEKDRLRLAGLSFRFGQTIQEAPAGSTTACYTAKWLGF